MISSPSSTERPRVILTGAGGFVGGRLAAALASQRPDWRLLTPPTPGAGRAEDALDVTDAAAMCRYIRNHRPEIVVHLAALTAVPSSVSNPRLAWGVNLQGTLNLVLALQAEAPTAHLLFISSAEVYGSSLDSTVAADETCLLQPLNAYAASKAAADILVRQAAAAGLSATVARPFNHTGPGQSEAFVAPSFAGQIARIEAGLQPPVLAVGSLDDERDFLDVDDVVAAYLAMLDARRSTAAGEVFNVASGRAVRVGEVLSHLLSRSTAQIEVTQDASRLRKTGARRIVGDASRLRNRLGWRPYIAMEDTLDRLLEAKRREAIERAPGA